jgi:hypothetical protein
MAVVKNRSEGLPGDPGRPQAWEARGAMAGDRASRATPGPASRPGLTTHQLQSRRQCWILSFRRAIKRARRAIVFIARLTTSTRWLSFVTEAPGAFSVR